MPSLRCYPSHGSIVGGYGIPAIPTPPSQGVQRSPLHQPSTHAPTLQSSHRINGIHRSFWRRRASHRFHRYPQMVRLRSIVPRNTQNAQKSLAVGGCSGSLVGAVLAWLVQWRPLHPLVGCVGMAGMPYPPTIA